MSEEKTNERAEETKADSGDGNFTETAGLIDNANKAAQRLEAANKTQAELLMKHEQLIARQALSGRADAGQRELSTEEKAQVEAKKIIDSFYGKA